MPHKTAKLVHFFAVLSLFFIAFVDRAVAQSPPPNNAPAQPAPNGPTLTLQQAEALALQNHPQVQAAQFEVNYSNQQIIESRAPYFPSVTGEITGSQGNDLSRIGA